MPDNIEFSVIIPAYNESACILSALERISGHVRRMGTFEIIVVDDASSDDTASKVSRMAEAQPGIRLLRVDKNRGKGNAVRTGMLGAQGALRLFIDADLSYPIEAMDQMVPFAKAGFDCVVGSRNLAESRIDIPRPFLRRFLGRCFSTLSGFIVAPGIHDFTCGIKLFTGRAADEIFRRQTIERWGFDSEILFLARYLGLSIKEVPVQWSYRADSRVRLLRDVVSSLGDLLTICKNRISGVYGPKERT